MEKTVCCLGFCSFISWQSLHQSFGSFVPLENNTNTPFSFKSSDNGCAKPNSGSFQNHMVLWLQQKRAIERGCGVLILTHTNQGHSKIHVFFKFNQTQRDKLPPIRSFWTNWKRKVTTVSGVKSQKVSLERFFPKIQLSSQGANKSLARNGCVFSLSSTESPFYKKSLTICFQPVLL